MNNIFAFDPKSFDTALFIAPFIAPARTFANLSIDYTEKLVNAQLEATKAFTDTNLAQLHSLVEIMDTENLMSYSAGQQSVVKELPEHIVKDDAETVVALQQDVVQENQKLTGSSAQESATKTTKESASKAK